MSDFITLFEPQEAVSRENFNSRFTQINSHVITSELVSDQSGAQIGVVTSVNGETGRVQLEASDVGARPSGWTPNLFEVGGSHENILDNWYLADPVNTTGKTVLTSAPYLLNGWLQNGGSSASSVEITEAGVKVTTRVNPTGVIFPLYQELRPDCVLALRNQKVCASCLVQGVTGGKATFSVVARKADGAHLASREALLDSAGLKTCTFTVPAAAERLWVGVCAGTKVLANDSVVLRAVKLELGSEQTLARQDASGNWTLIDPPPKPWVTVEPVHASNENILDNSHFAINQSGTSSFSSGTAARYFTDRWFSARSNISVLTGAITLAHDGVNGADGWIQQKVESTYFFGKAVSMSAMVDGVLETAVLVVPTTSDGAAYGGWEHDVRFSVANWGGKYASITVTSRSTTPKRITAVKMELGSEQTLAHQENGVWVLNDSPPNYQQELAKCQRYLVVYKENSMSLGTGYVNSGTVARVTFALPVPMRTTPSVSFDSIGGFSFLINGNSYVLTDIKVATLSSNLLCLACTGSNFPVSQVCTLKANLPNQIIFDANL